MLHGNNPLTPLLLKFIGVNYNELEVFRSWIRVVSGSVLGNSGTMQVWVFEVKGKRK